jgi:hypothetical protein
MEIDLEAKAVLAELDRCDGHLMHDGFVGTVNLYDGDPAVRGFGQLVEMEIFAYLRENRLVAPTAGPDPLRGPGQKQYKITEAGRSALRTATRP